MEKRERDPEKLHELTATQERPTPAGAVRRHSRRTFDVRLRLVCPTHCWCTWYCRGVTHTANDLTAGRADQSTERDVELAMALPKIVARLVTYLER